MSKKQRHRPTRRTRLEILEPRQLMSADPIGGLLGSLEHHVIADETPILVQHEAPPSLEHHGEQQWDFWLDATNGYQVEDYIGDLEQTLNSAHNLTGLTSVRANYGFTGVGQTVAVIDSGIAYDHYALGGGYGSNYRVVGGWDFTEGDSNPYDDGTEGSHGTHVSGIVGGTGDINGNDVGVAPGVDLVGLRVFNDDGNGSFGWVENALNWVIANRTAFENPITAINLSLGTTWNSDTIPFWANLEDEFAALESAGVFIAVSAGNSFTSYNSPGVSYPAASPYVVPVMSVSDSGSLSWFSQRLSRAIAAPGQSIRSTVPDYVGNQNGVTDDWANYSGTSMAAPYVAGSSVLLRQAMDLVGYTNITQDTIYDHMMATADSFFDSATGQNYSRLNLANAINSLIPDDDYGSTTGTAHSLGSLSGDVEISGMISTLSDIDYFSFTAAGTGTVTFSADTSHQLTASWDTSSPAVWQEGEGWVMNVIAGQSYTIGLSTTDGLGYYDLSMTAETSFSFVDWSTVTGQQQHNNVANNTETWYRIAAGQSGYVTAEAFFASASGNVDIALFNANQSLLASANHVAGGERLDYTASAGQELFLRVTGANNDIDFRLTNQVATNGSTFVVTGMAANDTVSFAAGSNFAVTVNGVSYTANSTTFDTFLFNGGGGSGDSLTVTGSSASEAFSLNQSTTSISGGGYNFTASGFENVVANSGGGANDTVVLTGTSGDESFTAWSDHATFTGATFSHEVQNFDQVTANAGYGNDIATFHDTAGDDEYSTWWNRALMFGVGYSNEARGFDQVIAYATTGNDHALMRDSSGDDTYEAWSDHSVLSGANYSVAAWGFDSTEAYANAGNDQAILHDTAGNDVFSSWWNRALMFGAGYSNDARRFESTIAYATTGYDVAVLRDSGGDDTYTAWADRSVMTGDGFENEVRGFDRTWAQASTGNDIASIYDSVGDDVYYAWSDRVLMVGSNNFSDARGFDATVGYSTSGDDWARVYDSLGDDTYTAWSDRVWMSGDGFSNEARNFARADAYSRDGADEAFFYDTAGDDLYSTWWDRALMLGSGYENNAWNFARTTAYSSGGTDKAAFRDSAGHDTLFAEGSVASISGVNFHHESHGFDKIYAYDTDGDGSDEAYIGAVDAIFNLYGEWTLV